MFKDIILAFFLGTCDLYSYYALFPNEDLATITFTPICVIFLYLASKRKQLAYICFALGSSTSHPLLNVLNLPTDNPHGYYYEFPAYQIFWTTSFILLIVIYYDAIISLIKFAALKFKSYIAKLSDGNTPNQKKSKRYEGKKSYLTIYKHYTLILPLAFASFIPHSIYLRYFKLELLLTLIFPVALIIFSYKNSMSLKSINYDSITINFLFLKKTIPFTKVKDLEQIPAENFRKPRELGGFTMRTNSHISYTVFHDANDDVFPTIADRITQGDTKCRTAFRWTSASPR